MIEVWLNRGKKLLVDIHVGAIRKGEFGLLLNVPHTTSKRDLALKLNFFSGGVAPIATISLTTKVSRS